LPVSAYLFIYREKIGILYGTGGLVSGVRNLGERSEFNRDGFAALLHVVAIFLPRRIGGFHRGG
jgi:hypothetical protein